jgi:RNA-directed DNA polymerase
MCKWYSLIDKVYSMPNLWLSYEKVRRNKGSKTAGIDGESIIEFTAQAEKYLSELHQELKRGKYKPQAVKRVYIDKPDGSKRPLGIPTIRDRIVQQALHNVLQPIFDPDFHPSSYGYRPNRSAHHAVAKAERFTRYYGLENVVDMDLSKCFDTLDHDLIIKSVNKKVSDGKVLSLITKFLKSGIMDKGNYESTTVGSPQGGIISPLLLNIYLDNFDQYMKNKNIRIVRYADDILIFSSTKTQSGKYKAIAEHYLEKELKLTVNRKKTHLASLEEGIVYLGFVIKSYGVIISYKSQEKLKDRIRELTPHRQGKCLSHYIRKLNMLLRGYSNYYKISLCKGYITRIMEWTWRRLRKMIMTAWKSWKPLHKQLRRMGYKGTYQKISVTRWRNSNSPLISMALPNMWFENQGLYNLEKITTNTLHQYYELNKI